MTSRVNASDGDGGSARLLVVGADELEFVHVLSVTVSKLCRAMWDA
jgi:hypothetical protein